MYLELTQISAVFYSEIKENCFMYQPRSPQVFKTETFVDGQDSLIGNLHLHIDGGDAALAKKVVSEINERYSGPGELNFVSKSAAGPQRLTLPAVYQLHTPVDSAGRENFGCFSTSCVSPTQLSEILRDSVLPRISGAEAVVEAEIVIGNSDGRREEWLDFGRLPKRLALPGGRVRLGHYGCEVHHYIVLENLQAAQKRALFSRLLKQFEVVGLEFGGLFELKQSSQNRSFWTNGFVPLREVKRFARVGQAKVAKAVRELNLQQAKVKMGFLVEKIVGIWQGRQTG